MFEIEFSNQAKNFLKKSEKLLVQRIIEKIEKLKQNPILHDTKNISGQDSYRIRIGKYRILYSVDYKTKIILISKIDKRSKAYQQL